MHVYLFTSIRGDWSFDDELHDSMGCEVHSFDPGWGTFLYMYFIAVTIWGAEADTLPHQALAQILVVYILYYILKKYE